MGSGIPGIRRKQHGGAGRTGCARNACASIGCGTKCAPADGRIFSWCAREAPSGLLEGIDDRLEAEALYSDAWFYDLCGVSLHVLYGRYSGQDKGSNWHELEGGNGAAEIIFAGDVNLDDDWEIMRHLKDSGGGVEDAFSSALLERLRGADVLVVNNEFPYSRRGVRCRENYTRSGRPRKYLFFATDGSGPCRPCQ